MSDRPVLLSILAVLMILVGLICLAAGGLVYTLSPEAWADLVSQNPDLGQNTLDEMHQAGLIIMIMGVISLIVGIALFVGWSLAWYLAVLALIVLIVMGAYSMFKTGPASGIVSVAVSIVIILYLFTPKVRDHFGV